MMDIDVVETEIEYLFHQFSGLVKGARPGVFDSSFWHGRLLDWAMADSSFKADLYRFIDVLPALETPEQVADHVREYLLSGRHDIPGIADLTVKAAASGLFAGPASVSIRKGVEQLAGRFIIAATIEEAVRVIRKEVENGYAFTADILGESTLSMREAENYRAAYESLVKEYSLIMTGTETPELAAFNHLGPIPLANVSLKISAMDPNLDSADPAGGIARAAPPATWRARPTSRPWSTPQNAAWSSARCASAPIVPASGGSASAGGGGGGDAAREFAP